MGSTSIQPGQQRFDLLSQLHEPRALYRVGAPTLTGPGIGLSFRTWSVITRPHASGTDRRRARIAEHAIDQLLGIDELGAELGVRD